MMPTTGRTRAWLKIKSYQVSELEVAAVLEGRGKPTMALMVDRQNNYLGGAFITNRRIKERLLARVRDKRAHPKGMEKKPDAQWPEPGVMPTIRHLRAEEDLIAQPLLGFARNLSSRPTLNCSHCTGDVGLLPEN